MQEESVDKNIATDESSNAVSIKDILSIGLHRWRWIAASVAVCLALAVVYLLFATPVYTRTASLLIKEEGSGSSVNGAVDAFSDLGLFSTNTNINNELSALKSPDIMEDVIKRLDLDMNYRGEGLFRKPILYGMTLPAKVSFPDSNDKQSASFILHFDEKGGYTVSDFKADDEEYAVDSDVHAIGDSIPTPLGRMVVTRGDGFKDKEAFDLYVTKSPLKSAVASYTAKLKVALLDDKGTVIDLTVNDPSVQRAEDILNTLIGVYNENWIRDKNQIAVSTSNFINDRLGVIESELGNVDQDISSYKSTHLIPDLAAASSMYMEQNSNIASQILELNNQLQVSRYIRNYLTADGNRNQVLPSNTGIENPSLSTQIMEYNKLLLRRNGLAENSSETNPIVVEFDQQLAAQRRGIITSIDNQIIALNTSIKNLQQSENQTTAQIAANPTQAKYLLSVERQQKVKETLYLFLLQKREENELSQAFTAYNTRVITRPTGLPYPTAPVKRNILLIAFMLGVLIPFGIIYVKEIGNTKIRGRKDLENLKVPYLGEIPMSVNAGKGLLKKAKKSGDNRTDIVVREGSRDIANEAFRVLRTNLGFLCQDSKKCNNIMITSFNPGSGKTFVSINLGVSFAIKGKRVLVIDGDLRHGSTSSFVGSPSKGISDYLSGRTNDVNSLITTKEDLCGLKIMPVGTIPPNPTELLENGRLATLLDQLAPDFDYIFIDCPPFAMMADAKIVDGYCDRTLFIVRAGLLERSMVGEIDRMYSEHKFKNMSVILNATVDDGSRYGYGYSYGYGYGKGYGYGSKGYYYGNKD